MRKEKDTVRKKRVIVACNNGVATSQTIVSKLEDMLEAKGITLTVTPEAEAYVAHASYSIKYGARNMRRYIQTAIEDPIATAIIDRRGAVTGVTVSVRDGALQVTAEP